MFSSYHFKRKKFLLKNKMKNETLNEPENERILLEKFKTEVAKEIEFLNSKEEQ